ncbi:unnamed protein product [Caenorhabditis auriculariae]|uniref:Serum response factor homolog n=1 Tax=Caenorhabditis auriculariae TaxID=2777116 RepID=A0A8S1H7B0_9PELO|nr:unnamed protein product [Caenorhabditis auriculariae]
MTNNEVGKPLGGHNFHAAQAIPVLASLAPPTSTLPIWRFFVAVLRSSAISTPRPFFGSACRLVAHTVRRPPDAPGLGGAPCSVTNLPSEQLPGLDMLITLFSGGERELRCVCAAHLVVPFFVFLESVEETSAHILTYKRPETEGRMTDAEDIAHIMHQLQSSSSEIGAALPEGTVASASGLLPNGKKTKGRVKIKMEYIGNKLRRYTTFSKRKTGIMKKAYELSTLTGTQVMLLVASETGHVYTYATKKLQPMISSDAGKALIQTCLNSPGEGTDLQPSRTEFTFETGNATVNPRKRKITDISDNSAAIASFLPTMVPTTLFSAFGEEDYNQDESGDDSDSEEASDVKEDDDKKDEGSDVTASLQQTLKDALKAAATTRQQQQKKQKPQQTPVNNANPNTFLAPFLLQGLTTTTTNNGTIFQLPQGCVYTSTSSSSPDSGANANSLFTSSSKGEDAAAANPLFSFPFSINLQQFMESAALGAQITNAE